MKRLLLAMGVALAVLLPTTTRAAQSLTVTPTSIDKTILPGQTLSGSTQVLNQADTAFDYKVYAAPYSVTGEDYDPSFTPIPGATDVSSWFTLKPTKTHLEPYSTSLLDYTIKVPATAKPGGYYAVIFAETSSKVEGTGVVTQKRVGTVAYIKVAGPITEAGRVITWDVPWLQEPNLTETLRIENTGAAHFPAIIHTTISDILGNKKFIYTQQRNVLPEKIRRVEIVWDKTPSLGLFKVSGNVEILGKSTPLSTKYVLVMSSAIRRWVLIAIIFIIVLYGSKKIYRNRKAKKSSKNKQTDDETTT
jgi:hypothetical protein